MSEVRLVVAVTTSAGIRISHTYPLVDSLEEALKKTRDIAGRIVRRLREQKSTISLKHPHTIYNVAQVASVSFEPVGSEELEEQFEKGHIGFAQP